MSDLYVQIDGKKRLRTQLESKLNITKKKMNKLTKEIFEIDQDLEEINKQL